MVEPIYPRRRELGGDDSYTQAPHKQCRKNTEQCLAALGYNPSLLTRETSAPAKLSLGRTNLPPVRLSRWDTLPHQTTRIGPYVHHSDQRDHCFAASVGPPPHRTAATGPRVHRSPEKARPTATDRTTVPSGQRALPSRCIGRATTPPDLGQQLRKTTATATRRRDRKTTPRASHVRNTLKKQIPTKGKRVRKMAWNYGRQLWNLFCRPRRPLGGFL